MNNIETKIEKARPEDAGKILEYLKIVGGETDNLTFGSDGMPYTVEQEREHIAALALSDTSLMLTAKKGDEIVGCAMFTGMTGARMKHRGEVSVSVRRSEWGQGIGSMLMQTLIDFARENVRVEIISLEVRSDNSRAIALYRKFGFGKIGTFPGFFKINGEYVDFDLMALYL